MASRKKAALAVASDEAEAAPLPPESVAGAFAASGYELAEHPAHIIRRAHQRATMCFQEVMAGFDLTPTQLAALATIMKHGELSQNQLGRLTAMDPSTIALVVRKLLHNGLVERITSATDQRLSIIRLTDKGVAYTLPKLAMSIEVGRRVLAPLSPAEQRTFLSLLSRIAYGEERGTSGK